MKKFTGMILTAVSLVCVALMVYCMLSNDAMSAALQAALLPIAGALVTAFAAGKLFSAAAEPMPAPSRA